jgi:hypothetical protein
MAAATSDLVTKHRLETSLNEESTNRIRDIEECKDTIETGLTTIQTKLTNAISREFEERDKEMAQAFEKIDGTITKLITCNHNNAKRTEELNEGIESISLGSRNSHRTIMDRIGLMDKALAVTAEAQGITIPKLRSQPPNRDRSRSRSPVQDTRVTRARLKASQDEEEIIFEANNVTATPENPRHAGSDPNEGNGSASA